MNSFYFPNFPQLQKDKTSSQNINSQNLSKIVILDKPESINKDWIVIFSTHQKYLFKLTLHYIFISNFFENTYSDINDENEYLIIDYVRELFKKVYYEDNKRFLFFICDRSLNDDYCDLCLLHNTLMFINNKLNELQDFNKENYYNIINEITILNKAIAKSDIFFFPCIIKSKSNASYKEYKYLGLTRNVLHSFFTKYTEYLRNLDEKGINITNENVLYPVATLLVNDNNEIHINFSSKSGDVLDIINNTNKNWKSEIVDYYFSKTVNLNKSGFVENLLERINQVLSEKL